MLINHYLFSPDEARGDPLALRALMDTAQGADFWFENSKGDQLHAVAFENKGPSLLVYNMGNDGDIARRTRIIRALLRTGAKVFIYEYAGFGKSTGRPTAEGVADDARRAFDVALRYFNCKPSAAILFGESLGGAIAAKILSKTKPRGIILKSTFTTLHRIAREWYPLLRLVPNRFFPQFNVIADVNCTDVPALVVHGRDDRRIGWHHALKISAELKNAELVLLKNSRHAFMSDEDEILFVEAVSKFLNRTATEGALSRFEAQVLAELNVP